MQKLVPLHWFGFYLVLKFWDCWGKLVRPGFKLNHGSWHFEMFHFGSLDLDHLEKTVLGVIREHFECHLAIDCCIKSWQSIYCVFVFVKEKEEILLPEYFFHLAKKTQLTIKHKYFKTSSLERDRTLRLGVQMFISESRQIVASYEYIFLQKYFPTNMFSFWYLFKYCFFTNIFSKFISTVRCSYNRYIQRSNPIHPIPSIHI